MASPFRDKEILSPLSPRASEPLPMWRSLLGAAAFELLLPAACRYCNATLLPADEGGVCGCCWQRHPRLDGRVCKRCAMPLAGAPATETQCLACTRHPPAFAELVAWGWYEGLTRASLHAFKYLGADALARPLGRRLAACVGERGWEIDRIAAVPMPFWRRQRRGYNPAQLLAEEVASRLEKGLASGWLRHRRTASQTRLDRLGRWRSAERSFLASPPARREAAGKSVLLVDDIATTGATAHACARALMVAGAARVWVAAVARTPKVPDAGVAGAAIPAAGSGA